LLYEACKIDGVATFSKIGLISWVDSQQKKTTKNRFSEIIYFALSSRKCSFIRLTFFFVASITSSFGKNIR
jgi:hypothetical protein